MQIFKKVMRVVISIVLTVMVTFLAQFMLSSPAYYGLRIKEFKNGQYDTIILGQSHAERGINPALLKKSTNGNSFNMARGALPLEYSYYILKELDSFSSIKNVYIDIDWDYWMQSTVDADRRGMDAQIIRYLSFPRNVEYFFRVMLNQNISFAIGDYNLGGDTVSGILDRVELKLSSEYRNGDLQAVIAKKYSNMETVPYRYCGQGFRYELQKNAWQYTYNDFEEKNISNRTIKAFDEIMEYCNKRRIKVVCFSSALPPHRLLNENYDEAHDYFYEFLEKRNIPFYDLNYLKPQYLERTDNEYADAEGHPYGELAEKQTVLLDEVISSTHPQDYFVSDYQSVLKRFEPVCQ